MSRPLRLLVSHPGASWSIADVFDGVTYGLRQQGVEVIEYRYDKRLMKTYGQMYAEWRKAKKQNPDLPKPDHVQVQHDASMGLVVMALRRQVDVVLIVSAMLLHPNAIVMLKNAGIKVTVLFTETPYDIEKELRVAGIIDGGWTHERSSLAEFRAVNPRTGYLPHAWHPQKHHVDTGADLVAGIPCHDVVFVGSAFQERVDFFNAIDWTGIDLGLYGVWSEKNRNKFRLKPAVWKSVRSEIVSNEMTAALYRRAKVGLNLYRTSKGFGVKVDRITHAESLSPRAYELAACGAFHLSEYRAEVPEVFGDLVPTFSTPLEAEALIRSWLTRPAERLAMAAQLPASVAEMSWVDRAATVLADLYTLLGLTGAHDGAVPRTISRDVSLDHRIRRGDERDRRERLDDQLDDRPDRRDQLRGREQGDGPWAAGPVGDVQRVLG